MMPAAVWLGPWYLYLPAAQRDPEQRDPEQRDPEQLVRVLVLVLPRGQVWQMF